MLWRAYNLTEEEKESQSITELLGKTRTVTVSNSVSTFTVLNLCELQTLRHNIVIKHALVIIKRSLAMETQGEKTSFLEQIEFLFYCNM